jgi:chitodextrinase
MVIPSALIEGTAVGTSATTLYTAPANQTVLLKKLTFSNTTNGALTLSVYLVPSGGSAGSGNAVRTLKTLAPYETFECYEAENQVLAPGDFVAATGSATGITARGSGMLVSN